MKCVMGVISITDMYNRCKSWQKRIYGLKAYDLHRQQSSLSMQLFSFKQQNIAKNTSQCRPHYITNTDPPNSTEATKHYR